MEGELTDGFYWIPSLGGPTSIEARNDGNGFAWLFPFVDGAPPLGWHDTIAYLVLPVLLVASQLISQKVMTPDQPKSDDPAQQQSQAILKGTVGTISDNNIGYHCIVKVSDPPPPAAAL